MTKKVKVLYCLLSFYLFVVSFAYGQPLNHDKLVRNNDILIVDRTGFSNKANNPISFGKRQLFTAIKEAGVNITTKESWTGLKDKVVLVLGSSQDSLVKPLLADNSNNLNDKPECVFYKWVTFNTNTALVLGGTDAKGTMYAFNEISEQIKDKGIEALIHLENTLEFPDNKVRGLDRFVKDENDDAWFFLKNFGSIIFNN